MRQHPAWGIDVTSFAVRGVQLRVGNDGGVVLTGWDVVDFTEEVEDTSSLARFAIMGRGIFHFLKNHNLKASRSWVSLRSETAFNRTVMVPPVNDEGLDKILEYEAQQQVPHPLDDVYWDHRVLAIRENGDVLATLYAIRKALVEERLRKFEKAGLPIDGVQLRAIALQNFCAYERLLEEGTIVIDVDYGGLQVLIHHEDQTWFRVLPVGGVDLVTRLCETFECNHRTAVRMATGRANVPDKDLLEACRREVAADIVDEAVRTVRYYMAARPDMRPSGVLLFQSHPCVPSLDSALKRTMDMPVFRPKGFRNIAVDPDVVSAGMQEHFPAIAKAAGLALQGIGKAEVEVRLFPDGLGRNLESRKTGYWVAAALVLATFLLAGFRRGATADQMEAARGSYEEIIAGSRVRSEVVEESGVKVPLDRLRRLGEPAVGRTGVLDVVEHLYKALAAWNGPERPQIVSIQHSASDVLEARLVLSYRAGVPGADGKILDPLVELDRFVGALKDGKIITEVKSGATWKSGHVTHDKPIQQPGRPLKFRFTHRVFTLSLGDRF